MEPTIRTLMIDLHTGRCTYWRHGRLVTYQQLWQEIRRLLADTYHQVLSGVELPDNILRVQVHGVDVARFEIK